MKSSEQDGNRYFKFSAARTIGLNLPERCNYEEINIYQVDQSRDVLKTMAVERNSDSSQY